MIDFIKSMNIKTDIDILLNNKDLNFESKFNIKTGETFENRKIAEYKNMKFEIVNNRYVNLNGSLHKYKNNGKYNYEDFTFNNLINVIIDLCNKFDLNPYNLPVNNLEFAVNVMAQEQAKTIIKDNIISYAGQQASISTFKGKGYLKEFEKRQYYVKIYDKSLQYNRTDNIFRFEIKVIKMEYLKKIGIKCLADLLNIDKIKQLGNLLVKTFNELLIYDNSIDLNTLNEKQKDVLLMGVNPINWEKLKPNSNDYELKNQNPEYKKDRKKYYRELAKFKNLIKLNNANSLQVEISKKIKDKWNELLFIDDKIRDKLTAFLLIYSIQKNVFEIETEKTKKGQIDTSNIQSFCPLSKLSSYPILSEHYF